MFSYDAGVNREASPSADATGRLMQLLTSLALVFMTAVPAVPAPPG